MRFFFVWFTSDLLLNYVRKKSWEKKEATEMEMSEWVEDKNGPWQQNRKKKETQMYLSISNWIYVNGNHDMPITMSDKKLKIKTKQKTNIYISTNRKNI